MVKQLDKNHKSRLMLVVLSELPRAGYRWDVRVSAQDLKDEALGQTKAVADACGEALWQGTIVRSGDCFCLDGRFEASVTRCCDRCLSDYQAHLAETVQREYALTEVEAMTDEECSVELLDGSGELSLLDTLREEIWLAMPSVAICSDTCKGLCANCGVNLNTTACRCQKDDSDHPLAALKKLKFDVE